MEVIEIAKKANRKPSKSYTLKSFAENIKKIKEFGYLTEEQFKYLREINLEIIRKYIQHEHGNN